MVLPAGTVTFLFTDIEGSTRLWEQHPDGMRRALRRHDTLLREIIERHSGAVFKTVGDAFCAAFAAAPDAIAAAFAAQRAIFAENMDTPLRVRMALHTGVVEQRDGDYFGRPLNRTARLLAAGYGGQVLISEATRGLIADHLPEGASMRDLGEHRLRDLARPEQVYQLLHPDLTADFPLLRTLENLPNNLPLQLTSFIGREREAAEIKRLLGGIRLLTLTGFGGCGKSRLAVQIGAEVLTEYTDGVWLVELAPLTDPLLLPQTVASAMGVREETGRPLAQTLMDHLRTRSALLILDNAEHLLAASAELVEALLRTCPHVRILVTSREALFVAGETSYPVPSLSLPKPHRHHAPESLFVFDAVRLFIDRAVSVQPSFRVTDDNAPAVAQVCYRLDGIPLAIELAAARVRALPVEQIALRLDDRFRLLTWGSRSALPRHQTLRALIDWSHSLLTEPERRLLRRLSAFSGGWTLEAAEAVCPGDGIELPDVLDLLTSLVDKSLVVYEPQERDARYRLLETIREYGREQLAEADEAQRLSQRHLDFYLSLAEAGFRPLLGAERGQVAWQDRLERDVDNLRVALEWSVRGGAAQDAALRLTGALWWFWLNSHLREGGEWTARALAGGAPAPAWVRARALLAGGTMSFFRGDYEESRRLAGEALGTAQEAADRWYVGNALFLKGLSDLHRGAVIEAQTGATEGLALAQEVNDRWLVGRFLILTGLIAWGRNDHAGARASLAQALGISRELQDEWHIAMSLANLGCVTRRDGDVAEARTLHREGLPLSLRMGDRRGVAWHLIGMAGIEAESNRPARAARLLGAADAGLQRLDTLLPPPYQRERDRARQQTEAALGSPGFAMEWAQGQAMTPEQAAAYALDESGAAPA